jgi:hypothetical protein
MELMSEQKGKIIPERMRLGFEANGDLEVGPVRDNSELLFGVDR